MTVEEELTAEELVELQKYATGTAPTSEEKHNVHKFLFDVSTSDDTTKTGYLNKEEVGMPQLPTRSLKELALLSEKVMGNNFFKEYFEAEAEIITSTSLSKDAKLLELAVVSRREMADVTKTEGKENKGWFKKKGNNNQQQVGQG